MNHPRRRGDDDVNRRSEAALALMRAVAGDEPAGFLEVRHRRAEGGWAQRFFPVVDVDALVDHALREGDNGDVFGGMAPRVRPSGRNADVVRAWVLSADCDGDEAVAALASFRPPPTFVVASGGLTEGGHAKLHAHWRLAEPVSAAAFRAAKAALAAALGSDPQVIDAARIMRLPGTFNHKGERRPVELIEHDPSRVYGVTDVVAAPLPPLRPTRVQGAPGGPQGGGRAVATARSGARRADDPLLDIPAAEYVPALTGRPLDWRGFVQCPLHGGGKERTPSLHPHGTLWKCFGCGLGGSVYDLAGLVAGFARPLRGAAFLTVQSALLEHFEKTTTGRAA
jgi:hypothetical protein